MLCNCRIWKNVGVLAVAAVVLLAVPAFGQDDDPAANWSDVSLLARSKPYIQWVVAAVFIVGCLAIAFKNPHRTHLD